MLIALYNSLSRRKDRIWSSLNFITAILGSSGQSNLYVCRHAGALWIRSSDTSSHICSGKCGDSKSVRYQLSFILESGSWLPSMQLMIFLQQSTPLLMQRRRCWRSVSATYLAASCRRCQPPVRSREAQSAVPAAYRHLWPAYIPVKHEKWHVLVYMQKRTNKLMSGKKLLRNILFNLKIIICYHTTCLLIKTSCWFTMLI